MVEQNALSHVLTIGEAADIWHIDPSALRHAIQYCRFNLDEIRKSKNTWLISYQAMTRLYGDMESTTRVYTTGYEGKTAESFVRVLQDNLIDVVLDVRATPLSRKKGFSKNQLSSLLFEGGIEYRGFSELGSPKEIRNDLYTTKNYGAFFEAYEKWLNRQRAAFDKIKTEIEANTKRQFCLLCFESNPNECHRSVVANLLLKTSREICAVSHI